MNTTPTFDAASTSGYEAALSTFNWSHTVGRSLPNRCLMLSVHVLVAGTVSNADFSGQAFTFVRGDANGVYRVEWWRLVNPAEGAGTITVNLSGSLTSVANASSYYNVDPTTPVEASATASGTGTPGTGSVTPLSRLAVVLAALTTPTSTTVTSNGAQTNRGSSSGALGTGKLDEKGPVDPVASTTLSWTWTGALDTWVETLVALKPAPTPTFGRNSKTRPRAFGPGIAR